MRLLFAAALVVQAAAFAQPKSILYVTHSAGFRHDSLPLSQRVLTDLGARSGKFTVTATEDLTALNDLGRYSAVVFFTSGELPLSLQQKQGLLDFVRSGGGFAGFHSATDTLYTWPEYGDLIGGRFDGHPWTQEVRIDIEDPDHPAVRHLQPNFSIVDEIYQFRDFSRDRARVLMTLDTTSVGIPPGDFPLAWTRLYGGGRVFYSALGHFDSTWQDLRFQRMLEEALLWITGQTDGEAQPRPAVQASLAENGIGNAATMEPRMTISPGSLVSIYGINLTTGATQTADLRSPAYRLAGTRVLLNGTPVQIFYASPGQMNVLVPPDAGTTGTANLAVQTAGSALPGVQVILAAATPGIFAATVDGAFATLWSTGLGVASPRVTVNGTAAKVTYFGLSSWPGLYQINVELPAATPAPYRFDLTVD